MHIEKLTQGQRSQTQTQRSTQNTSQIMTQKQKQYIHKICTKHTVYTDKDTHKYIKRKTHKSTENDKQKSIAHET